MIKNPTSFYFLRHGKTQANLDGLMCGGSWDIPLCDEGIQQATLISLAASKLLPRPVSIFSSPMIRAQKTAEIVAASYELPISIINDLREWEMGEWDRTPFEKVKDAFLGDGEPPKGETRVIFRNRILNAIQACAHLGEPPLIVSHGGVALMLQEILSIPRTRVENCHILYFSSQPDGKWMVKQDLL